MRLTLARVVLAVGSVALLLMGCTPTGNYSSKRSADLANSANIGSLSSNIFWESVDPLVAIAIPSPFNDPVLSRDPLYADGRQRGGLLVFRQTNDCLTRNIAGKEITTLEIASLMRQGYSGCNLFSELLDANGYLMASPTTVATLQDATKKTRAFLNRSGLLDAFSGRGPDAINSALKIEYLREGLKPTAEYIVAHVNPSVIRELILSDNVIPNIILPCLACFSHTKEQKIVRDFWNDMPHGGRLADELRKAVRPLYEAKMAANR